MFMQENKLYHLDIKPSNILYDNKNFLIIDFGTSSFYHKNNNFYLKGCTRIYTSPEL